MPGRRRSGAWSVFFAVFAILAAVRGVTTDNGTELALAVVVFGLPCILFGYWAVRRRPALVIGPHALTEGRSGRVIAWSTVTAAHVRIDQGLFGESHALVLALANPGHARRRFITTNRNNPDAIEISLDFLSVPWSRVAKLVEAASGYAVPTVGGRA